MAPIQCAPSRRILGALAAANDGELWRHEWGQRVSCWFSETPLRAALQGCAVELGDAISTRLSKVIGADAPSAAAPRKASCAWIRESTALELPDFPSATLPELPPLPELLPWGLRKWNELGEPEPQAALLPALVTAQRAHGGSSGSEDASASAGAAVGGLAVAGFVLGMVVTFGLTHRTSRSRSQLRKVKVGHDQSSRQGPPALEAGSDSGVHALKDGQSK